MKYQILVLGRRGGIVTVHYFTDKAKAYECYTNLLAKYLDYEVEFNTMQS